MVCYNSITNNKFIDTLNSRSEVANMAKAKSRAELEQRIIELEEQLNISNDAYNRLMQKYNELNQKKGEVIGYEQIKRELKRKEMMYDMLKESYDKLSNKYNAIIGTKKGKGRPKKEVSVSADEIKARMKQGETAEQIANELGISRMTLFRRLKSNKNK